MSIILECKIQRRIHIRKLHIYPGYNVANINHVFETENLTTAIKKIGLSKLLHFS